MDKSLLKKLTPYLVAIIVFLGVTFVYFSPLLEGKKLKQHDITMFKGMSKEISDFRESTGEEALWTNSMFGGMPAWQISVQYKGNLIRFVDKVVMLGLPYPANYVFLYFLGFFVLLVTLRVNPWVGLAGAIAFAMSSYFFIILGAGHTSKAHAIGYMAPVLAGIILTFRGKYLPGSLLTALALALEIKAGHLQITYYLLILILTYGFFKLAEAIQKKQMPVFIKATGFLLVAAFLAVLTHSTNLWATYEYGKETMRGKPELTKDKANKSGGLDKDYITAWSYGTGETWSLLIPNAKGGASGQIGNRKALEKADRSYRSAVAQQNGYWGDQPFTSGPVYVGVIVVFLFLLGLFIVNTKLRWALLAATILSIMLAWGKNFMPLTDFFIDYFPGYNKFRAVSMILVIAELTMPLLAFLALDRLVKKPGLVRENMKAFYISLGLTAGIILLFYMVPDWFLSFFSQAEQQQFGSMLEGKDAGQVALFMNSLEDVRIAIFRADALRSLLFVSMAGGLIFAFTYGKIKKGWLIAGMALLVLADLAMVDRRYLNNDSFVRARAVENPFSPMPADRQILQDKDPDFRVLDLTKSTFNDAGCSYFHKSIGGYHGAKLQRYQDLIEHYIQPEIGLITSTFSGEGMTFEKILEMFKQQQVLGMLNTRYVIYNPDAQPLYNTSAFGNAWMVSEYKIVGNADEEIAALGNNDLRKTAIVDGRFASQLEGKVFKPDAAASISLKSYAPNHLVYSFNAHTQQLVVFSEIYYDKGWNAYIDGKQVPYFRANYVLRAMVVPEGKHTIDFKFEPRVWVVGEKVSFVASLLLILLFLGWAVMEVRRAVNRKIHGVEKQ
ncbi:MAG: YfhO family protein [Bacteroidales bacterium]|nr:YfhO family protein [Bacteroidales bacterium]